MSEASADSENNELKNMLEERENKLNDLLDKMDKLQSEVDDYNSKISNMNFELEKCKQEQTRVKLINKNLSVEPKHIKRNRVSDDTFTGEHLELIKSKRDEISHLSEQINQLQAVTQPIDDLVTELQQENTVLLYDQSDTQKQIQKSLAIKKRLNQDIRIANDQLKELNIRIINQERVTKDVELVVSGLITRRDAINSQTDPNSELTQKITSLRIQTELIEMKNEEMLHDIQNYEENKNDFEADVTGKIQTVKTKINWEREKTKLENELKEVQGRLESAKQETKDINSQTNVIENRMSKLQQIYRQVDTRTISKSNNEDLRDLDIDKLISEYRKLESSSRNSKVKSSTELDQIIAENSQLEATILRKKEELQRSIPKFQTEKAQLKNEIKINRTNAFEREHQLIEQIRAIKVKIASKSSKK